MGLGVLAGLACLILAVMWRVPEHLVGFTAALVPIALGALGLYGVETVTKGKK